MRERILQVLAELRQAQSEVLAGMPIAEIVEALSLVAGRLGSMGVWECGSMGVLHTNSCSCSCSYSNRARARARVRARVGSPHPPTPTPPYPHTLHVLLASLQKGDLWALLQEELGGPAVLDEFRPRRVGGMSRAIGPQVIGHVLAGNTPLLSWPSLAAALLVKSASLGKLSRDDTVGPRVFHEALRAAHPGLARCIALEEWAGGTRELDSLLCTETDAIMAYGSDAALAALRALTPVSTPFHGYGHRLSLGLILRGADEGAAAGLAQDVLLYDQQGCLSAAMVFVEGDAGDAARFGERLAKALERQAGEWGLGPRDAKGAGRVRSLRETALFAPDARVWGDPGLRWTVVLDPGASPEASYGCCVVPLHPLPDLRRLPEALAPLRAHLQGAALAAPEHRRMEAAEILARAGVSRICAPGALQAPPFSWHHDGRPVLSGLVRWVDLEGA